jgi:hypothetical protein
MIVGFGFEQGVNFDRMSRKKMTVRNFSTRPVVATTSIFSQLLLSADIPEN